MPETLTLQTTWGRDPLPAAGDGQLAYLLLDVAAAGSLEVAATLPLNLTLVLDHSGSMGGPKLQHLKEAVTRVIDTLGEQDTLSIVVFDEHAKVLAPAGPVADKEGLKAAINGLREAGGTAMSSGLKAGLDEVRRALHEGTVSRILLLTDGQTWGDAEECERLAQEAGQAGIPISAFGVGADEDWSVSLLDKVAAHSNGQSDYIADPANMVQSFRGTVQSMQNTAVKGAVLALQLAAGVTVRNFYRITPMLGRVKPSADSGTVELPMGDVQRDQAATVLAELLVPPRRPGQYRIARAVVRGGSSEVPVEGTSEDVLLTFELDARTPGNPRVMNLVEKATAFKLQTRALEEAEVGNTVAASKNLRSAATRLLNLGETDLAAAAESEAARLEERGQMSAAGTKKLTFATRKLAVDDVAAAATPTAAEPAPAATAPEG
ncbi:MAG TPA: VWA domain-containing protein [Chloroflexia bacterium]|nr:VWA domain-containing protein [Chloroflexia bacterium]